MGGFLRLYIASVHNLKRSISWQESGQNIQFAVEPLLLKILFLRDKVQHEIEVEGLEHMVRRVAVVDSCLRKLGRRAFNLQQIDMASWRAARGGEELGWWWHLDNEWLGLDGDILTLRSFLYGAAAIGFLILSIQVLYETSTLLAGLFVGFFVRTGTAQTGLDVFSIAGVLAQFILGGRISIAYGDTLALAANKLLAGMPQWGRRLRTILLPISRFFMSIVMFVAIVVFVRYIAFPALADQLQATANEVEQPLGSSQSLLASAYFLNPSADYSRDLTLLGLRYETVGDYGQAAELYEEALASAQNRVFTAYRLSQAYLKRIPKESADLDRAIIVLDRVLLLVEQFRNVDQRTLNEEAGIGNTEYLIQIEALALISRGNVFLQRGYVEAALQSLTEAESIVNSYPTLFRTIVNRAPTAPAPPVQGINDPVDPEATEQQAVEALTMTEMHYLLARTFDILAERTDDQQSRQQYIQRARSYWVSTLRLADTRIGQDLVWRSAAETALQNQ